MNDLTFLVSPATHQALSLQDKAGERLLTNALGEKYRFIYNFPDLTYPQVLTSFEKKTYEFYENRAEVYDKYLYQTFKTHNENELEVRNSFIDKLKMTRSSRVLEVACGTGRDSEIIAGRLNENGQIVLQDISPSMLKYCESKLSSFGINKQFIISNAAYLPFPDRYFDCVYSFGGLGEFPEIAKSLKEMVRVTKIGGKIVVGDESMPPWLRDTYFSMVLSTTNPQFEAEVPLKHLPVDARKLNLQWVIGGVFYLIDFEVGDGEPTGNFDYEVEGVRGGTLRTRYEGQLEGVTKEAKELAYKAAGLQKKTMHRWLDEIVKKAAIDDLG